MKKIFITLTTLTALGAPLALASCSTTPNQNNTTTPETKPEPTPPQPDKPNPTPPTTPEETPTPPVTPEEKPEVIPPTKPEKKYPYLVSNGPNIDTAPYFAPYYVFAPAKDGKTNYFYKIGKEIKDSNGKPLYRSWYGVASYLPFEQFFSQYAKGQQQSPNKSSYSLYHSILPLSFDFEKHWELNSPDYLSQMQPSSPENSPTYSFYDLWINTGRQDEKSS